MAEKEIQREGEASGNRVGFLSIEEKWQKRWEKEKAFEVSEDKSKKKYYVLEMFPYPSAAGLHMGHTFNYTIGDVFSRFKWMQGFNVLHPGGYDSLGSPAENSAIKEKMHPEEYTNNSIKNFMKQQKKLGLTYDWTRCVNTADPGYYKWDQWIFLKMYERNLVYEKEAAVNWCPKCNTILSNEQVHDGNCWRHEDTKVEIKRMNQWFLKITDYADRLLDHSKLNWPEKTVAMQKNWIGKSHGTEIDFNINNEPWPIFTTRADTIFGVTFMVVSAQHPRLKELVTKKQEKEVEKFLKKIKSVSEKDMEEMEKEGVFTGSYAINPANGDKVPVYAGNFVVADYGAGMVMAVPAHDQRDFEFAKKYKIPIKQVIAPMFMGEPRENVETLERRIVTVIIEHWKGKKFLVLKEKNNEFIFVGGGIEDGENPEQALKREIKEETGYLNFEIEKILTENLFAHGFRETKNRNQKTNDVVFYVKLKNDKKVKSEADEGWHEILWMNEKEVENKISWKHHRFMWDLFSKEERAFTDEGKLVNSGKFNGINSDEAIGKISDWLIKEKKARKTTNYKLRDWSVARQRYWGAPIPLIHCAKCGIVPVPEKDLPVELPKKVKFGEGNPLLTNKEWLNVKCPKCGGKATREANTMDTFVNSSWYFLRFCDPNNNKEIFAKEKAKYWMPVDLYIGGAEHACMHLIYCRFYTMFLHDIGLINFDEPVPRLFHQGMINDPKGEKMSKSKGNVVEPIETMNKYGVDTTRFFMMAEASPDKGFNWSDAGIQGSLRFTNKVYSLMDFVKIGKDSKELEIKINKAIKNITEQIETLDYRKATIELRELFDLILKEKETSKETLEKSLKLLSPFCPHITEELWEKLGNKGLLSKSKWPEFKEIKEKQEKQDITEQVISYVNEIVNKVEETKEVKKIFIYVMPFELGKINKKEIDSSFKGKKTEIYAVNDAKKHDPEGKAKKALPGKPGVWVE